MVYSCAYFHTGHEDIDTAQAQKLGHLCRKLRLRPGDRLLDIGCGWGGLLAWATRRCGVTAVGITLSRQQYEYAKACLAAEGLEGWVEVRLQDYRELCGEGCSTRSSPSACTSMSGAPTCRSISARCIASWHPAASP
jgi:cyclopropane-fatty-acyl-phospholipid synthase